MYLKLYKTADNALVSVSPIEISLRSDLSQVKELCLYLKSDSTYSCSSIVLSLSGTGKNNWALATGTNSAAGTYGSYGADLNIAGPIGSVTPSYVWIRAKSISSEEPVNDNSTTLNLSYIAAKE